jgi:hypothetical protein
MPARPGHTGGYVHVEDPTASQQATPPYHAAKGSQMLMLQLATVHYASTPRNMQELLRAIRHSPLKCESTARPAEQVQVPGKTRRPKSWEQQRSVHSQSRQPKQGSDIPQATVTRSLCHSSSAQREPAALAQAGPHAHTDCAPNTRGTMQQSHTGCCGQHVQCSRTLWGRGGGHRGPRVGGA